MSNFFPNLPVEDVKTVVMSTIDKKILNRVEALGIEVIPSENIQCLLPFERTHTDMQIFHYSQDEIFVLNSCEELADKLKPFFQNVYLTQDSIAGEYPKNVLLNAVSLNGMIICKADSLDSRLQSVISADGKKILNTKQGYTKCSTCIVSENAIITSDRSICKVANGSFDVLLINSGHIDLLGTDYGFIGGCTFKLNKDILAFTGNINRHPDYLNIKAFCRNHNVYLHSLTDRTLKDIGSIIPIS